MTSRVVAILFASCCGVGHATGRALPFASGIETELLDREGKWWVKVGEQVYHQPSSGLSPHVKDYYHAVGSHAALTDDMKERRVGGSGRQHIFYLPEGPSVLNQQLAMPGSRRSSFSALMQLQSGMVVEHQNPVYKLSQSYAHPLSLVSQNIEREAVRSITQEGVMSYLTELTSMPKGTVPTRSWKNLTASAEVRTWLTTQLESMGITVCEHRLSFATHDLINLVGFVKGRTQPSSTVTVGAHYDSRPFEGKAPGANDNGSGTAALLAIAKAFMDAKVQPEKSVYFALFAAEEAGLVGSGVFAKDLQRGAGIPAKCTVPDAGSFLKPKHEDAEQHKALIMDEIGWKSSKAASPKINLESYDWTADVLEHLAQSNTMHNIKPLALEHSSHPFGSDHMSFLHNNMKAVLSINYDDEGYPNYHSSNDDMSNIDPELLHLATRMNLGGLIRMSGM